MEAGMAGGVLPWQVMDRNELLLLKTVYEMQIWDILNELSENFQSHQLLEEFIAYSSDDGDEENYLDHLLLMEEFQQAMDSEDEETLMSTLVELNNTLKNHCVIRPYSQPFITSSGSNRVTHQNLSHKFPPSVCKELFRFECADILQLINILEIPPMLNFDHYRTTSLESMLLLLRRLSSHCRYIDLAMEFDIRPQFQSQIFNGLVVYLFRKFGNHVRTIDNEWVSGREQLQVYSAALQSKGCPLQNCVGWADGTHIPVCRPGVGLQRPFYCGQHKKHCFKALGIMTPTGLLAAFGPFDGSTHDAMAADIVGLDQMVQDHMTHDRTEYNLFLDAGYPIGRAMITPYHRVRSQSREELEWNRLMCRNRIAVEWGFGKLKTLFKMLTFKVCYLVIVWNY